MTVADSQGKRAAAAAALRYVEPDTVLGVGSGSTVNLFIEALAARRMPLAGAIASSEATAQRLRDAGIAVLDLNTIDGVGVYVDGADEALRDRRLIKGGGVPSREKIVAAASRKFVCIVDESKIVDRLGRFPLPLEVIPMAREYVARELRSRGGRPVWRPGYVTDNGNHILDVHDLAIDDPVLVERELNQIVGVVCVGLFAQRPADLLLVGRAGGVDQV